MKTPDCVSRANWNNTTSHASAVSSCSTIVNGTKIGSTLNPIVIIRVYDSKERLKTMFDNCSQSTFIKEKIAKMLGLSGKRISFVLVCTDGSKTKKLGFMYKLTIKDIFGNSHTIEAIGLDNISSAYAAIKVTGVKRALQDNPRCRLLSDDKLDRDSSDIDLLIGTDLASLHPEKIAAIKDLIVMKTQFGNGFTLMGHHQRHVNMDAPRRSSRSMSPLLRVFRRSVARSEPTLSPPRTCRCWSVSPLSQLESMFLTSARPARNSQRIAKNVNFCPTTRHTWSTFKTNRLKTTLRRL